MADRANQGWPIPKRLGASKPGIAQAKLFSFSQGFLALSVCTRSAETRVSRLPDHLEPEAASVGHHPRPDELIEHWIEDVMELGPQRYVETREKDSRSIAS